MKSKLNSKHNKKRACNYKEPKKQCPRTCDKNEQGFNRHDSEESNHVSIPRGLDSEERLARIRNLNTPFIFSFNDADLFGTDY